VKSEALVFDQTAPESFMAEAGADMQQFQALRSSADGQAYANSQSVVGTMERS
jgi:hypothetical protein